MLEGVVAFCAAHQVAEDEAATVVERGRDTGLPLAGPGAPFVSEFAIVELASALRMTIDACKRLVGQVLEVRYRLAPDLATGRGRRPGVVAGRPDRPAHHRAAPGGCGACGPSACGGGPQGRGGGHREALPGSPRSLRPRPGRGAPPGSRGVTPRGCAARPGRPARHRGRGRGVGHRRRPRFRDRCRPGRRSPQSERLHRHPRRPPLPGGRGDRPPLPRRPAQRRPRRCRAAGQTAAGRHQRPPARPGHRPLRHHPRPDLGGAGQGLVHPPRHPGDDPADPGPQRAHPGRRSTKSPTGSTTRSPNATAPASTPGAPDPPPPATTTTASPTTTVGQPAATTSPHLCRRHHRTKTHRRWRYRFLRPGHYLWRSPTAALVSTATAPAPPTSATRSRLRTPTLAHMKAASRTTRAPSPPRRAASCADPSPS